MFTAVLIGGSAATFAAIPNSTTGQISSCRLNLTGVIRIIDAQSGASCIVGETPLNWAQSGGNYFVLGGTDTLVANSSGVLTHAHTTPFTGTCNTGDFAEEGVLTDSGTGAATIVGPPYMLEGDRTTLSSFTDSSGTGYNVGDNTGIPNTNITLKFYVLCLPVPTLPS